MAADVRHSLDRPLRDEIECPAMVLRRPRSAVGLLRQRAATSAPLNGSLKTGRFVMACRVPLDTARETLAEELILPLVAPDPQAILTTWGREPTTATITTTEVAATVVTAAAAAVNTAPLEPYPAARAGAQHATQGYGGNNTMRSQLWARMASG